MRQVAAFLSNRIHFRREGREEGEENAKKEKNYRAKPPPKWGGGM